MPVGYTLTAYDRSLLDACEQSKQVCGFDGPFSLPDEARVLLEAEGLGARRQLMRVMKHLGLDQVQARNLFFTLLREPEPESVQEVEQFFEDILRR